MDTLARVKHLIGTTAEWAAHDLVAGEGEMVLEQATGGVVKAKLGDGASKFSALAYFGGLSTMPLGTVALPGLPFTGDPDTGIYSPGANQLGFSTAGFRRLGVDGAGNWDMPRATGNPATLIIGANTLGLGLDVKAPATAAELAALRITDSTGNTARLFVQADNTKAVIGTGSLPLELWTNGTPRLSFAVGGNASFNGVSVGGIAPGSPAAPGLSFAGDPNTGIYSPGADALALATGGVARLTVSPGGNVAVGVPPTQAGILGKLVTIVNEVNDPTAIANATLVAESMFRNANVQLRFPNGWSGGYQWTDNAGVNRGQLNFNAALPGGQFAIQLGGVDRMTVSGTGNFVLGTPQNTGPGNETLIVNAADATHAISILSPASGNAVARIKFTTQNVRVWALGTEAGDLFTVRDVTRGVNPIVIDGPTGKVTIAGDLVVLGTINGSTGGGGGTAGAMPPGTAALPGLPFVGDADTGFFSPGANLLSIATQGIERLRVFADGGITMTQPSIVVDTLTVNAVIGANALTLTAAPTGLARMGFWNSSVRNWGLGTGAGDTFTLRDVTRAADVLTVDAAGNFGINCVAVVGAPLRVQAPGFADVGIEIGRISATVARLLSYDRSIPAHRDLQYDASQHVWDVAGVEKMRIDTAGNVGIGGTPEAAYRLQVIGSGGSTTDPTVYRPLASFYDAGSSAAFGLTLGSHPTSGNQDQGGYIEASSSITMRAGFHWIWQTTGGVERMRIDAAGNVGMGGMPLSPSVRLSVYGHQQVQALVAGGVSCYWNDSAGGLIGSFGIDGTGAGALLNILTRGAFPITFGTNLNERMRIGADGVTNITGSLTVNGVPVSRSDDLTAAVDQLQQQIDALLARVDAL